MNAVYVDGEFRVVPGDVVSLGPHVRASTGNDRSRSRREARRRQAREAVAEWVEIANLAEAMRGDMGEPDMLVDGWLQRGALHWFYGQPEDGKSWAAAWCCAQVINADPRAKVLMMDGEMGRRAMATRLDAFGLTPEIVERQVVYVQLSPLPKVAFDAWVELAQAERFRLVVWDPLSHYLAGADYDENSNSNVAQWVSALAMPVSAYGGTTVIVDHLPRNRAKNNAPIGATAKMARARVAYQFTKRRGFDRTTVGRVDVWCRKNSDSAPVVTHRELHLGGTPFTWRESNHDKTDAQVVELETTRYLKAVVAALEAAGSEGLPKSQLESAAEGNTNRIRALLDRLASEPGFQDEYGLRRIESELREPPEGKGGRKATWFRLAD